MATKHTDSKVLACILCQQRKIKCDRRFPCAHCLRAGAQCTPASLFPRKRRRRFPERDLLDRLRHYESLLRQNNIAFDPLHPPTIPEERVQNEAISKASSATSSSLKADENVHIKSEVDYDAKSFWQIINRMSQDTDDDDDDEPENGEDDNDEPKKFTLPFRDPRREAAIKNAWDQFSENNDHLLFNSRMPNIVLSTLHPGQVQIFRLWQVYVEKVNPLLKITHVPTLQSRLIDAASDVMKITPTLEALMFSIYCVAILNLTEEECRSWFASSKQDLLANYRFACQQALLASGYLRTTNMECLTAFYLYLISVRQDTDPRSLSSMLGIAVRIAQRMGLHNESQYAHLTALEAELGRRLWWSLVSFDSRIGEMSDQKASLLNPTWNCRLPINVNDIEILPEAKFLPEAHEKPTEALFIVVRSEMADFIRHSDFHLEFTNPALKPIAKGSQSPSASEADEVDALERLIENKYFAHCDIKNPLHFMTIWTTRAFLAKYRLLREHARYAKAPTQQTEARRNEALSNAIVMLECDTTIMDSPLVPGFQWLVQMYFPFSAYLHIVQELKKRPLHASADHAWTAMSENYEARFLTKSLLDNPFFSFFTGLILSMWEAREAILVSPDKRLELPPIIADIRRKMEPDLIIDEYRSTGAPNDTDSDFDMDRLTRRLRMGSIAPNPFPGMGWSAADRLPRPDLTSLGQTDMDIDLSSSDWTPIDWEAIHSLGL